MRPDSPTKAFIVMFLALLVAGCGKATSVTEGRPDRSEALALAAAAGESVARGAALSEHWVADFGDAPPEALASDAKALAAAKKAVRPSWCGLHVEPSDDGNATAVNGRSGRHTILCHGKDPGKECPEGFARHEETSLPHPGSRGRAGSFAVCVPKASTRLVPSREDASWCGVFARNEGTYASMDIDGVPASSGKIDCLGVNVEEGCPSDYDRFVYRMVQSTSDDHADDFATCIRRPGSRAPLTDTGGWLGIDDKPGLPAASTGPLKIAIGTFPPDCPEGTVRFHYRHSAFPAGVQITSASTSVCLLAEKPKRFTGKVRLEIASEEKRVPAGTCQAFVVSTTGDGLVYQRRDLPVSLADDADGQLFAGESCAGNPDANLVIPNGASRVTFSYRSSRTARSVRIRATAIASNGAPTPVPDTFTQALLPPLFTVAGNWSGNEIPAAPVKLEFRTDRPSGDRGTLTLELLNTLSVLPVFVSLRGTFRSRVDGNRLTIQVESATETRFTCPVLPPVTLHYTIGDDDTLTLNPANLDCRSTLSPCRRVEDVVCKSRVLRRAR